MKIAIAGAGIAGRLLALKALDYGWQPTIFEKDPGRSNCSYAAAGMLCPVSELEYLTASIYSLGLRSLALWPSLLAKLDRDVFFQKKGSLITAHPADRSELTVLLNKILKTAPTSMVNALQPQALQQLEPDLALKHGYFIPDAGQIDVTALLDALQEALLERAAVWKTQRVREVRAGCLITDKETYYFDWVFDCRGLGASQDIPMLRGIRGELIHVHAPDVQITRPIRLYHPRYPLYILPRPEQQFIVGASIVEAEDYSPVSVKSLLEFLSALYSLHPGFSEARVTKTVTQCRPTMPNHKPYIEHHPGLSRVNGLYRYGYLVAPAIVEDAISAVLRTIESASAHFTSTDIGRSSAQYLEHCI